MGFIYLVTSPCNKTYIGQTLRDLEDRFKEHQREDSGCVAFVRAINKYGWNNFTFDYYECPDDELDKHERWMISLMGTLSPSGYNLREGGKSGKCSEEAKKKMSEVRIGMIYSDEHKKNISESKTGEKNPNFDKKGEQSHMFGKKFFKETKEKMSESRSGAKNHNAKRVYQYDLNDNYIDDFDTCREAAKHLNKTTFGNISSCAVGKRKTAYGFIWKYDDTRNLVLTNH
ncbi:GIY-YIG catalytic domain-containing endonuclease [Paramecium bursaria Chlorella virus MA1E]|nr:GIY-YIG catalytic domain-containing endonuclease [Paramecium bursaria Chlorella virus MA1E]